jgi:mRNA-degrading endonuclease RelE of RelBE toxin-antitoxin system
VNDIQFIREARKDLERLRSHEDQALRALGELRENAQAGKALQGSLRGLWSLRFGRYRIIYTIDGPTVILVILVGPRENVYKEAERRYKALR